MKRIIITIVFGIGLFSGAMSQSANDAILMSQYYAGGTARSVGMSGAFGALGGDISTLSTNPAGLAVYRGSEFTFTPGVVFSSTDASYDGLTFNDKSSRFIISNIGYVYTKNFFNEKGLQSINFGFAYNRLADFNSNAYVKRPVATSSMLDEFVYYANGIDGSGIPMTEGDLHSGLSAFYEGLAWDTYALNIDNNTGEYYSDYNVNGYDQPLNRTMSTRGGIGEYDLSMGLNFNHKLFVGATLGIQSIYYQEYYFHEEEPGFTGMEYFNFSEEYKTNGWGLNFKAGLIYRPIQMLRLGAAIHTPTYLWLQPYHLTGMETWFGTSPADDDENPVFRETESDPAERYDLKTPWRYSTSAAMVFGNIGMAGVDVEFVDYSSSKIKPESDYDLENDDVSVLLKSAVNVKGGAEFKVGPVILRGGVAYYGSPYKKDYLEVGDEGYKGTMSYSGGIGFRARNFYMDAAYSYMKHPKHLNNLYLSYNDTKAWYEQAKLNTNSNKVVLTFGFRF